MDGVEYPPFHICSSDGTPVTNPAQRYYRLRGLWMTHLTLFACTLTEDDAVVVWRQDSFIECSNN